ncbi:hypothetical protein PVAG01_06876 [Phlyctema vagabunda]|uniref:Enoyl reductase (ER) domain-containing protein n=1 Tax=Phlyctema vagabunda TaxID=108571 RepID=A0ABR4PHG0_9HELO
MAFAIPTSMQAIALDKYSKPSEYKLATLPTPEIQKPTEILIKVHAASINPIDVKLANGMAKALSKDSFPFKIGYDVSGTVAAVGSSVTIFKVGDEIFSRVPGEYKGSVAEYVLSIEDAVAHKPAKLSFSEAASIPLAALTALQCMEVADQTVGGLKGKTVLVPAGLSGTGSFAVQLAKNVFGAAEVITTLSTGKIPKAKELLGEDTFTAIDYTKEDVAKAVGKGKVDYLFDTMATTMSLLGAVKKGGVIVSISTMPSGDQMRDGGMPDMPVFIRYVMNLVDWFFRSWTGWAGVNYKYIFMHPSRTGLDKLSEYIQEGKITPIVGRTAKFSDIEAIRTGCGEIYDGKGGIGKFVIEMV